MEEEKKAKAFGTTCLLLLALVIGLERWHTYTEPLERDITTYAVIGHELLSGRKLYSDLWDCKPPLLYLSFSAAEILAGYGPSEIFLLNILAGLLTLWGVYRAGNRIGGMKGGLWASLFWTVISGDLYLQANQPNIEVFLNASLTWAFVFWLETDGEKFEARKAVAVGLFLTAASFYKHVYLFASVLAGLLYLAFQWKEPAARKAAGSTLIWISGLLTAAWGLLTAYFFLTGRLRDFIGALVTYNFFNNHYGADRLSGFLGQFNHDLFGPDFLVFILPLFSLGLGGLLSRGAKNRHPWVLWLVFLLTSEAALFAPGLFHPHYYQLLLPWLAIGGGWGTVLLGERLPGKWKKASLFPGLLVLLAIVAHEAPFYLLPARTWSEKKYGEIFIQTAETAKTIDRILQPGESFYEWGNETGLYFLTQRSPPSGLFYAFPLMVPPLTGPLSSKTIEALEKNRPELFVFSQGYLPEGWERLALMVWLRRNYRFLPGMNREGMFLFFMLKGGSLEKRLEGKV